MMIRKNKNESKLCYTSERPGTDVTFIALKTNRSAFESTKIS